MKTKLRLGMAFCAAMLVWSAPASAHHSVAAEFDSSKSFSVTGTITKIEWVNPHVYFYADVKGADGNIQSYSFESLPPGLLRRGGIVKTMFNVGDVVTFDAFVAKDGTKHLGFVNAIHFADGHSVLLARGEGAEKL